MSQAESPVDRADQDALQALLEEVYWSRRRAAQLRSDAPSGPAPPAVLAAAQRAALDALEDYSAALHQRGWPTPREMGREIRLLRSVCGTRRPTSDG